MNAPRLYFRSLALASAVSALLAAGCSGGDGNQQGSAGSASMNGGSTNANGGSATMNGGSANANGGSANANGGSAGANGGSAGANHPQSGPCAFTVYDGEPGSAPSAEDGLVYVGWPMETNHAKDITDAHAGTGALQNVLDPNGTCCGTFYYSWTNWEKIPNKIIDATQYDNLELWIKIESGLYWNLQIELQDVNQKSSFTGNDVHIADFIDGKNIDMTWRQAKVPIAQFNTNGIDLTHISRMVIEGDKAVTFDLDDIQFTKTNCK